MYFIHYMEGNVSQMFYLGTIFIFFMKTRQNVLVHLPKVIRFFVIEYKLVHKWKKETVPSRGMLLTPITF